jgi:hypothetical protein
MEWVKGMAKGEWVKGMDSAPCGCLPAYGGLSPAVGGRLWLASLVLRFRCGCALYVGCRAVRRAAACSLFWVVYLTIKQAGLQLFSASLRRKL